MGICTDVQRKQVVYNKYPFASTPHWVRHVNPETGAEKKIVGIPVAQAESWEEGYQGSVKADALQPYEGLVDQKQFLSSRMMVITLRAVQVRRTPGAMQGM